MRCTEAVARRVFVVVVVVVVFVVSFVILINTYVIYLYSSSRV